MHSILNIKSQARTQDFGQGGGARFLGTKILIKIRNKNCKTKVIEQIPCVKQSFEDAFHNYMKKKDLLKSNEQYSIYI